MPVNLDNAAAALGLGRKPADWHTWGQVERIEADGAYSVRLNGAVEATRCAPACTAEVGDRVLVCCMTNGRCAAVARLGVPDKLTLKVGGRVREPLRMGVGDASGDGVVIGAGGRVIVGAGESAQTLVDAGVKFPTEELNLASDGPVYIHSNLNGGWDQRKTFSFSNNGVLTAPGGFQSGGVVEGLSNKVLWTGELWPIATQEAKLSEAVTKQPHGIVLVWSYYNPDTGTAGNNAWNLHFVPKDQVARRSGQGVSCMMADYYFKWFASKYVYISDTKIVGHATNDQTRSSCDVNVYNNRFCLRQVIGL